MVDRAGCYTFASLILAMIQRIQSIWFLLAGICSGLLFAFPLAGQFSGDQRLVLKVFGWMQISPVMQEITTTPHSWITTLVCTLVPFTVIFQFRRRIRQIRTGWLMVLLNVLLAVFLVAESRALPAGGEVIRYTWAMCLPLFSIVFLLLAISAIRKDEKLVRSADRLR